MKNGPDRLRFFEDNWPTDKGAWFPGEKVHYREKQLFEDFSDRSWMTLLMYGIKGEMPSLNEARMLELIWTICASFPDPRIWNNRVGALAGSARTTAPLGVAAATAVSEASIYGRKPDIMGASFLHEALKLADDSEALEAFVIGYLKRYRSIPGFGRPLISVDERIEPLLTAADNLGLGQGECLQLVSTIEEILQRNRYRLSANISIYCAAIFADIGYSPRENVYIALLSFSAGILPCYIDALEKPEGVLFPLDCGRIRYSGATKRRYVDNEPA